MITKAKLNVFIIFTLFIQSSYGELARVINDEIDLYKKSKIRNFLVRDEIVHVKDSRLDDEWFEVFYDSQTFLARKDELQTLHQAVLQYERNKSNIINNIERLNTNIHQNDDFIVELFAGILQVQWDRTVFFQLYLPSTKPTKFGRIKSEDQLEALSRNKFQRIKRVEKISLRKAKKLNRRWQKEIDQINKENTDFRQQRLRYEKKMSLIENEFERFNNLVNQFTKSPDTYLIEPYVVIGKYASLFHKLKRIHEISMDEIVLCNVNRDHPDRLKVEYFGSWYDALKKSFRSKHGAIKSHRLTIKAIESKIENFQDEIQLFELRKTMVRSFKRNLSYSSNINDEFVRLKQVNDYGFNTVSTQKYWIDVPAGATEVIHRSRAHRLLRDWEKELEDLEYSLNLKWLEVRKLKQEKVTKEATFDHLIFRMNEL